MRFGSQGLHPVIFSSPEHKVLRVSNCDRAVSEFVVRSASSVVNFLPCVRCSGHIFSPILMNLVRMFDRMKSRMTSNWVMWGQKLGH